MKVVGFDGREHSWPKGGHYVYPNDRRRRSEPHLKCRALLSKMYPLDRFLEEVPLPGSEKLTADFYLPWRKIVIEVHGEQHYKFTPFFHGNKIRFLEARQRDRKKIEWCNQNNIGVIELAHYESEEQWREKIERGA